MMNAKYTLVVSDIRQKILSGHWRPGARIPTREELVVRYKTSRATIQKAMDELLRGSFISANGKGGTFVSDSPPNLSAIGVLLPAGEAKSPAWDALWSNIVAHGRDLELELNRSFVFYFLGQSSAECLEFRKLCEDSSGGKLSGAIMPFAPQEDILEELRKCKIPLAAITRERHSGINTVWLDYGSFFRKALERLAESGCRTVALLTNCQLPEDYIDGFRAVAEEHGVSAPESLIQGAGIDSYSQIWIGRQTRLMMESKSGRPDALIVANENMLEAALNGIQQAGLAAGRDIKVVSHCNFPAARPNGFGVDRIGFSVRRILRSCVESLAESVSTGSVAKSRLVAAEAEGE